MDAVRRASFGGAEFECMPAFKSLSRRRSGRLGLEPLGLPSNRRKPEELRTEALRKWPHHAGCGDNRVSRLPLVARVQEADDEDDGRECGSALCVDRMKASLTLYPLQSEATTHLQFRKQDYGVSSITAEVHV